MPRLRLALIGLPALLAPAFLAAQNKLPDSTLVHALTFRSIGPAVMSGRIADVAVTDARNVARQARQRHLRRRGDGRSVEVD